MANRFLSNNGGELNPAQFQARDFDYEAPDVNILANSLKTIEERANNATQQEQAFDVALGAAQEQLHQDEETQKYFNDFKAKYKSQLDNLVSTGRYGDAMRYATRAAGEMAKDAELTARIKSNKEYEEWKNNIENNNTISRVTKDRFLEQNKFNTKVKYDENGNFIGLEDMNLSKPVAHKDLSEFYAKAKNLAGVEAGGSQNIVYLDENGNPTSDPSKGFYGMAYKTGSTYERLPYEKLKRIFDNLLEQDPEMKASILQDMDDELWLYNKEDDENKKKFIGGRLIDEQGLARTPEEYIAYTANPILSDMAYNHQHSTIEAGDAYSRLAAARKQAADNAKYTSYLTDMPTGTGPTIKINHGEEASRSYVGVMGAYDEINRLWKNAPNVLNNPEYKRLVELRDYEGVVKYLTNNITTKDPHKKADALRAIDTLKHEGEIFSMYINNCTREEREV